MTACALNSNAPTTSRELLRPRSTFDWRQDVALHAVNCRPRFGQRVDAVTEFESQQSLPLGFARTLDEGREDSRPGAPGHVKARHRVAVADGVVAAALGPADHWKEAEAARVKP